MNSDELQQLRAYAGHPGADRDVLARIAVDHPDVRKDILANPGVDEPLKEWIRQLPAAPTSTEGPSVGTTAAGITGGISAGEVSTAGAGGVSGVPEVIPQPSWGTQLSWDGFAASAPPQPGAPQPGLTQQTPGAWGAPTTPPGWNGGAPDAPTTMPMGVAGVARDGWFHAHRGLLIGAGAAVTAVVTGVALVLTGVIPLSGRNRAATSAIAQDATKAIGALPMAEDPYTTEPQQRWTVNVADLPDIDAAGFVPGTTDDPSLPNAMAMGVGDDVVLLDYTTSLDDNDEDDRSATHGVVALDRATGDYRWSHQWPTDGASALGGCGLTQVGEVFGCVTGDSLVLLDAETGEVRSQQSAGDVLGQDGASLLLEGVHVDASRDAIVVTGQGSDGSSGYLLAEVHADGSVAWQAERPGQPGDQGADDAAVTVDQAGDSLLVELGEDFGVFSLGSGELRAAGTGQVWLTGEDALGYTGTTSPLTVNALSNVQSSADADWASAPFAPSQRLGLRLSQDQALTLRATDTATGETRWSRQGTHAVVPTGLDQVVPVWDPDNGGTLTGVSATDGSDLWQLHPGSGASPLITGGAVLATGGAASVTMLGTDGGGRAASTTTSEQAGVPACSDGRVLLSWSRWQDGWISVCSDDSGKDQVVQLQLPDGTTHTGDQISVNDGWTRFCGALDDGDVCTDWRDSTVTWQPREDDGTVWATSAGWFSGNGRSGFGDSAQAPETVPSCPVGASPLGWGVEGDDWVLVCGDRDGTPTTLRLQGFGGDDRTAADVHASDDENGHGVCGAVDGASVCFFANPGSVVVDGASERVQTGLTSAWQRGQDDASASSGAFGAQRPSGSAQSQVQYIVDVLERSKAARTTLQPAVDVFSSCRTGQFSQARATLRTVTQNRQDLLAAISSAPVDRIEDGDRMMVQLRTALQASLDADKAYEQWADAIISSGCGAGSASFDAGNEHSVDATTAKQVFTGTWNTSIATRYGVATFGPNDI